eukprot:TRINITY_DN32228_c0_g1_i1.p1 TRINITY_DN32228_c0_g1~~TRINITY_DN32228_c0_g1_i1.p1  ORF type:complete len:435 (+),score=144.09 TRINITY_DN32228_c0_g1_i1:94-1305(+)
MAGLSPTATCGNLLYVGAAVLLALGLSTAWQSPAAPESGRAVRQRALVAELSGVEQAVAAARAELGGQQRQKPASPKKQMSAEARARLEASETEARLTLLSEEAGRAALDEAADGLTRTAPPIRTRSVVLNAWGKQKYVDDALAVVRNVRAVTKTFDRPGGFVLWTNRANKEYLSAEALRNPFIQPRYYEDFPLPKVVKGCPSFQAPPAMFLAKIVALTQARDDLTVVLDNDIHVCEDLEGLYPRPGRDFDVASAVAPFARWGGAKHDAQSNLTLRPATAAQRSHYAAFQERNVGVMFLRTSQPAVQQLLKDWLDLFVRHTSTTRACSLYHHEQPAFREALYKLRDRLVERLVSTRQVCRFGDQVRGCTTHEGCARDGCAVVHCRVKKANAHRSRAEIRGGGS